MKINALLYCLTIIIFAYCTNNPDEGKTKQNLSNVQPSMELVAKPVYHNLEAPEENLVVDTSTPKNQFTLLKEYPDFDSFKKGRRLLNRKSITIASDRKSISYTFDGAQNTIRLQEELPSEVNNLIISPKQNLFVGFNDSKAPNGWVYLYNQFGEQLTRIPNFPYPSVKYASNEKTFLIRNAFGNNFAFYSNTGELIAEYPNYQNLINSKMAPLEWVDVAPDKKSFLLYSDKLYLLSLEDNSIIWAKEFPFVYNSIFLDDKIILACNVIDDNIKSKSAILISRSNGKLIDELTGAQNVYVNERQKILFSKDKKYFEYGLN